MRKPPERPIALFWKTLRYLIFTGLGLGYVGFVGTIELATEARIAYREPMLVLAAATLVAVAAAFPYLARAAKAWVRTLPVDGTIRQIALAVRDAMVETGVLSPSSPLDVEVQEISPGVHVVALRGGTFFDQSVFADAMDEALGPVENPRYLVTRSGKRSGIDYHAVPGALAANKEKAGAFHRQWIRRMGPSELVYTRTAGGRRALLQARSRSFSSTFIPPAERLDRWQ